VLRSEVIYLRLWFRGGMRGRGTNVSARILVLHAASFTNYVAILAKTFVMAIDRTSGLRGANFGQTAYHLQRRFGCEVQRPVSALGQKQTFAPQKACLL